MAITYSEDMIEAIRDSFVASLIDASPLRMRIFRGPYDLIAEIPCAVTTGGKIVSDKPGVTTSVALVVVVGAKGQFLVSFPVHPPQLCSDDSITFDFEPLDMRVSRG